MLVFVVSPHQPAVVQVGPPVRTHVSSWHHYLFGTRSSTCCTRDILVMQAEIGMLIFSSINYSKLIGPTGPIVVFCFFCEAEEVTTSTMVIVVARNSSSLIDKVCFIGTSTSPPNCENSIECFWWWRWCCGWGCSWKNGIIIMLCIILPQIHCS